MLGVIWAMALALNVPRLALGDGAARAAGPKVSAPETERRPITLSWVGDITLGSRYGLPPDDGRALFAGLRTRLRRSDLTVGNLEGTLSVGGASKCAVEDDQCFSFQAPPANAAALRWAGFDLMNLANNHAYDFGSTGQSQTIAALDDAAVEHTGLPAQVTTVVRRGTRVAFVGFAPYPWANDPRDVAVVDAVVRSAQLDADVVVVLAHLGSEGSDQAHVPFGEEFLGGESRGDTRAFAHAAVDAGADLVLASGPHVLRGIDRYRGSLVAYSLGNFAGYRNFATSGVLALSGVLTIRVAPDGEVLGGRLTSVRLDAAGVPSRDATGAAAVMVSDLGRADFGDAAVEAGPTGELR